MDDRTYTPRYVRTARRRKRRLTLAHVVAQQKARAVVRNLLQSGVDTNVWDWLDVWHVTGGWGMHPSGIGRTPTRIYASRFARLEREHARYLADMESLA